MNKDGEREREEGGGNSRAQGGSRESLITIVYILYFPDYIPALPCPSFQSSHAGDNDDLAPSSFSTLSLFCCSRGLSLPLSPLSLLLLPLSPLLLSPPSTSKALSPLSACLVSSPHSFNLLCPLGPFCLFQARHLCPQAPSSFSHLLKHLRHSSSLLHAKQSISSLTSPPVSSHRPPPHHVLDPSTSDTPPSRTLFRSRRQSVCPLCARRRRILWAMSLLHAVPVTK